MNLTFVLFLKKLRSKIQNLYILLITYIFISVNYILDSIMSDMLLDCRDSLAW